MPLSNRKLPNRKLASKRRRCGTADEKLTECFTLEINDRPTLVMIAPSLRAACRRVSEQWLLDELAGMRSGGVALLRECDRCHVRPARLDESTKLQMERALDELEGEDTKYAFAFLVPIDARPS